MQGRDLRDAVPGRIKECEVQVGVFNGRILSMEEKSAALGMEVYYLTVPWVALDVLDVVRAIDAVYGRIGRVPRTSKTGRPLARFCLSASFFES